MQIAANSPFISSVARLQCCDFRQRMKAIVGLAAAIEGQSTRMRGQFWPKKSRYANNTPSPWRQRSPGKSPTTMTAAASMPCTTASSEAESDRSASRLLMPGRSAQNSAQMMPNTAKIKQYVVPDSQILDRAFDALHESPSILFWRLPFTRFFAAIEVRTGSNNNPHAAGYQSTGARPLECNSRYIIGSSCVARRKQELLDKLIDYLVKHGVVDLSLRPDAALRRLEPARVC